MSEAIEADIMIQSPAACDDTTRLSSPRMPRCRATWCHPRGKILRLKVCYLDVVSDIRAGHGPAKDRAFVSTKFHLDLDASCVAHAKKTRQRAGKTIFSGVTSRTIMATINVICVA
jgi:hypothetical protein